MCIKFFLDENLGGNLVDALRNLNITNIEHLTEVFEEGTPDTDWLEYIGRNGYALITKDKNIRKNPKEKQALIYYKIIAFYLGGKNQSILQIALQLLNNWNRMEKIAKRQRKKGIAGAFVIRPRGGKIEEIPLC